MPLEVAEHRRVEVPGGGEPPAQAVPGDRAQRLVPLAARQAPLAQLRPAARDADEAGGPHRGQGARQRVEGRVAGEDVRPAPEQHPHHLEVAAERVEERQVAQQHLALAHRRQRRRAREALRDEREAGVHDALRQAGAAGREHDGRGLVEGRRQAALERALHLRRGEAGQRLGQPRLRRASQRGGGVEHEGGVPRGPRGALGPRAQLVRLRHDDVDAQAVEDEAEGLGIGLGVEGRDRDAVHEAGEVGAGGVEPVRGEDRHPRPASLRAEEDGGRSLEPPRGRLVAPEGRARQRRLLEQRPARVLAHPLGEHRRERVARGPDGGERRVGPAVAVRAPRERLQEARPPGRVEEAVPEGRGRPGLRGLGGRQDAERPRGQPLGVRRGRPLVPGVEEAPQGAHRHGAAASGRPPSPR